ncbi:hypothetical protein LCGC14_1552000 [marine sediment metagenome]|uniref:Bacteriophage T4 Gp32 single-stranded DNA-binding domain-containing protein n=1 Tax=marine sediment metagenome TaxID=412755 RepID=A0A0F9LQU1_9ZZZZ
MSTENFGMVSWDQVEFMNRGSDNRKRDKFIRLQSGSNVVRLVTKPFQYVIHKWKEEGDKGYGDKVMCSMFHGSCPLCEKGDRPKQRWYIGLIDRKTQSYNILDMSPLIFQAVQKLNRNENWGDPGTYDIDIVVDKDAGATGYYTVMPLPKTKLSDKDVEVKTGEVDLDSLKKRCNPPEPGEVVRQMGVIRQKKRGRNQETVETAQAAPAPTPVSAAADGRSSWR